MQPRAAYERRVSEADHGMRLAGERVNSNQIRQSARQYLGAALAHLRLVRRLDLERA